VHEITDRTLILLLEWMADEEKAHADFFSGLINKPAPFSKSPFVEEMDAGFLKELIGGNSLSLNEVDFAKVDTVDELLNIFIGFEEDSILFYQMILPMIDDSSTLAEVERIVSEEKIHIRKLRDKMADKEGQRC
jgi:rubrerythrin